MLAEAARAEQNICESLTVAIQTQQELNSFRGLGSQELSNLQKARAVSERKLAVFRRLHQASVPSTEL